MRTTAPIIFAMALATSHLTISGCDGRDEVHVNTPAPSPTTPTTTTAPTTTAAGTGGDAEARTAGERVGDVGEMMPDSAYEVLSEAIEAAVTEGGFDDLVERFADNDRRRFSGVAGADFQPLDNATRGVRDAYRSKYGRDFDIDQPAAALRPLVSLQPKGNTQDKQFLTARVQPKQANVPAYDITMVKDVTWHIDIPDNYDAQSLRQELVRHLGMIGQGNSPWPADHAEAQRLVAYHVLAALANSRVGGIESDAPGTSAAQAVQNK